MQTRSGPPGSMTLLQKIDSVFVLFGFAVQHENILAMSTDHEMGKTTLDLPVEARGRPRGYPRVSEIVSGWHLGCLWGALWGDLWVASGVSDEVASEVTSDIDSLRGALQLLLG